MNINSDIDEVLALHPGNTALVDARESLTHLEVLERTITLASELRTKMEGVCGALVAIVMDNSCESVIISIALQRAGFLKVNLDPYWGIKQIGLSLYDLQPHFVIMRESYASKLITRILATQGLNLPSREWVLCALDFPLRVVEPDGIARPSELVPTSGSIKQKYVLQSYDNHMASVNSVRALLGSRLHVSHQRVLQTGLPSRLGLADLVPAWIVGGASYLSDSRLPADLANVANETLPTTIALLPEQLDGFAAALSSRAREKMNLLIYGGAPVEIDYIRGVVNSFPNKLLQGYGSTEAVPPIIALPPERHEEHLNNLRWPLGYICPGVRAKVIFHEDQQHRAGELAIRSGSVGQYCLTSGRQWEALPTSRGWFLTGDMVSIEGSLFYFEGRTEGIISRGLTVDTNAVEACLRSHPLVESATVSVVVEPHGGMRLSAAVRPTFSGQIDTEDLFEWCAERVPRHMIPRYYDIIQGDEE